MIHKIKKIILFSLPIFLTLSTMGIYFGLSFYKNHNPTQIKTEEKASTEIQYNIFPKLKTKDFYKDIRIKNKIAYINEQFISSVVQYLIKNLNISDGFIKWGYEYLNSKKNEINISFKWIANFQKKIFIKTYYINLEKENV